MTLCIAAGCDDNKKPAIVTATDWKMSTGTAGAEVLDKLRWIGNGWGALIAGNNVPRALQLVDRLSERFSQKVPPRLQLKSTGHCGNAPRGKRVGLGRRRPKTTSERSVPRRGKPMRAT